MASPSITEILTNKQPNSGLQLNDIHLPALADFWPLAHGWWILLVLIILALFGIVKWRQWRAKKQEKAAIIVKLRPIEAALTKAPTNALIAELNTLLRQISVNYYPRRTVAGLTGKNWLVFLDAAGDTTQFSQGVGEILADAPYQTVGLANLDQKALLDLIEQWISHVIQRGTKQ